FSRTRSRAPQNHPKRGMESRTMDARDQAIAALVKLGWSQGNIARALHIAQPSVFKRIQRLKQSGNGALLSTGSASGGAQGNSLAAAQPPSGPSDVQGAWSQAPLHDVLAAAFHHGLKVLQRRGGVCLQTPADFPPALAEALERLEEEFLWVVN